MTDKLREPINCSLIIQAVVLLLIKGLQAKTGTAASDGANAEFKLRLALLCVYPQGNIGMITQSSGIWSGKYKQRPGYKLNL